MNVDFEGVECRSAFHMASAGPVAPAFGGSDASASAIQLVELRDVLYLPNILEPGQSICLAEGTFVPKESVLDPFAVDFLKSSRRNHPEFALKYAGEFAVESFEPEVCILGNLFSRNFGHWTEELLKVVILEQSGRDCLYAMPTLPSFARAFLLFLGIDDTRIITVDAPTLFARATFTTAISHENISVYPEALVRFRELVRHQLGDGQSTHGTRLWLEREAGLNNTGVTSNKDEVYTLIGKYDFDVVDMATLSLPDQLRTMLGATVLAGPHGAQFVHAQFMPASSTVIECFSPVHVNPSILQICRALNHSYHQVVARAHMIAPYRHGRDCEVDCEHLSLILDSL